MTRCLLTEISNKYGCDKSDRNHGYTRHYHNFFEKYRHKEFNILEYGYGLGKSVKMWMEYFTNVKLVTVDIRPVPDDKIILNYIKEGRLEYINLSQIDKTNILNILDKYKNFFVIIDDASHVAEDQQFTFGFSFPYVVNGGWYIIEDLKCKRSHSKKFEVKADKTLKVLNNYLINNKFNSKVLNLEQNLNLNEHIESVKIYDKIAFIKKKGIN